MDENIRVIEINGVKMEIDLRTAKTIENYKVGDRVKVLRKLYSTEYRSYVGMIVGFDAFKELPTIVIAYLDTDGSSPQMKFAYLNAKSEEVELCPMTNFEELPMEKSRIIDLMQRQILKHQMELEEAQSRLKFFIERFGVMFERQPEGSAMQ